MKIVITAGPTREPIDPVRFLSNRSSGKMGYAIAAAAIEREHDVTLISGPVGLASPDGVKLISVLTADEMFAAVHAHLEGIDVLVMAAAVADFKPAEYTAQKIKKDQQLTHIALVPTRDILKSLCDCEKNFHVVGFAAETESVAENALKKLHQKKLDLIVANDVSRIDTGFESDDNEITLYFRNGKISTFSRSSKQKLARKLMVIFETF